MGGGLAEVGICGSRGERRTPHGHDLTREPRPGRPGSWLLVSPRGGRGAAAAAEEAQSPRLRSPGAGAAGVGARLQAGERQPRAGTVAGGPPSCARPRLPLWLQSLRWWRSAGGGGSPGRRSGWKGRSWRCRRSPGRAPSPRPGLGPFSHSRALGSCICLGEGARPPQLFLADIWL